MSNFTVDGSVYDNQVRKLETTDPNHADTFNVVFQQLIDNIEYLKQFPNFEKIGNAIKLLDSLYIGNDNNIFGYKADGSYSNLATMEQNDIAKYGDFDIPTVWLMAQNYISLRAQNTPSFQLQDADGKPVGPGRTFFHQGNNCYHFIGFANSEQTLTKNVYQRATLFNSINGQFPPVSWGNNEYTIPRSGVYLFSPRIKITQPVTMDGVLRVRVSIVRASDGATDTSDMADIYYSTAYDTPFLTTNFQYRLSKDDRVSIELRPYNENLTIGTGSSLNIYGLGDVIQL